MDRSSDSCYIFLQSVYLEVFMTIIKKFLNTTIFFSGLSFCIFSYAIVCEDLNLALNTAFSGNSQQPFAFTGMSRDNTTCEFILSSQCDPEQEARQIATIHRIRNSDERFIGVGEWIGPFKFLGAGCSAHVSFTLPPN